MSKNQKECSLDNDYENFKDSKKEINMVIRYCYIQGPTARCNKSSIYIFKW